MTTPTSTESAPTVLICSFLEAEHVTRIREASPGDVLYAPDLLPKPRYRNDHTGTQPTLSQAQQKKWRQYLARADVCFDFDWMSPDQISLNAPRLRWIQATSSGIGGFVQRHKIDTTKLTITTAAGIHAQSLAEFAVAAMLHFIRDIPRLQEQQRHRAWKRYQGEQLAGRTVTVVGLGAVGRKVTEVCSALGTDTIGIVRADGRRPHEASPTLRITADLDSVLPGTDVLVLCCPLTEETRGLLDASRIDTLPPSAVVINLARGPVIDEDALAAALLNNRLAAAALDVFTQEPLPTTSPLWDMPNVLVSPHSASTVAEENALLTDLFLDNLARYIAEEPQRNRYQPHLGY